MHIIINKNKNMCYICFNIENFLFFFFTLSDIKHLFKNLIEENILNRINKFNKYPLLKFFHGCFKRLLIDKSLSLAQTLSSVAKKKNVQQTDFLI